MNKNKLIASSKSNPCPVCGRTKDNDCRVSEDGAFILCHTEINGRKEKEELNGFIWLGVAETGNWGKWVAKSEDWKKERPIGKEFRYPFTDQEGNTLVEEVRIYTADSDGSAKKKAWMTPSGVDTKKLIPYRYNEAIELLKTTDGPCLLVEGPPKVDALRKIGINASTFANGFKPSRDAHWFEGYENRIIVVADQDKPGIQKADRILKAYPMARLLKPWPDSCWWEPEWLPEHKGRDILDWIEQGATRDQILAAVDKPDVQPDAGDQEAIKTNEWKALAEENYEFGVWKAFGDERDPDYIFVPKSDFTFSVERILEDSNGGGLVLRVQRVLAGKLSTSRVVIPSLATAKVSDFIAELKKGLGTNVSCTFNIEELQRLLHVKTEEYRANGGKTYKLCDRVGQQDDGTWVFELNQLKPDGKPTSESETRWVFNTRLGVEDCVISPKLAEPNEAALPNLAKTMRSFFGGPNFLKAVATLGWFAAGLHFQKIIKEEGSFPLLNLIGDPGSTKTIAAECGLSLYNWWEHGFVSRASESALYERLKLSGSLPNVWDDPSRGMEIEAISRDMYNAKPRVVRGNAQYPHAPLAITSNHAVGDSTPATLTRMIQLFFSASHKGDKNSYPALRKAIKEASGAFPQLISIGYDSKAVREKEARLISHLPYAHSRIAQSLAILWHYTEAIAKLANLNDDIEQFMFEELCPAANDIDTQADSLMDFLGKLSALQSRSLVGEWNLRVVENSKGEKEWIAVHFADIWGLVDREFSPPYSQKIIRNLIVERGGKDRNTQKFAESRDMWQTYQRQLIANKDNPPSPASVRRINKRCWLIPYSVASEFLTSYQSSPDVTNFGYAENAYGEGDRERESSSSNQVTKKEEESRESSNALHDDPPAFSENGSLEVDTLNSGYSGYKTQEQPSNPLPDGVTAVTKVGEQLVTGYQNLVTDSHECMYEDEYQPVVVLSVDGDRVEVEFPDGNVMTVKSSLLRPMTA